MANSPKHTCSVPRAQYSRGHDSCLMHKNLDVIQRKLADSDHVIPDWRRSKKRGDKIKNLYDYVAGIAAPKPVEDDLQLYIELKRQGLDDAANEILVANTDTGHDPSVLLQPLLTRRLVRGDYTGNVIRHPQGVGLWFKEHIESSVKKLIGKTTAVFVVALNDGYHMRAAGDHSLRYVNIHDHHDLKASIRQKKITHFVIPIVYDEHATCLYIKVPFPRGGRGRDFKKAEINYFDPNGAWDNGTTFELPERLIKGIQEIYTTMGRLLGTRLSYRFFRKKAAELNRLVPVDAGNDNDRYLVATPASKNDPNFMPGNSRWAANSFAGYLVIRDRRNQNRYKRISKNDIRFHTARKQALDSPNCAPLVIWYSKHRPRLTYAKMEALPVNCMQLRGDREFFLQTNSLDNDDLQMLAANIPAPDPEDENEEAVNLQDGNENVNEGRIQGENEWDIVDRDMDENEDL